MATLAPSPTTRPLDPTPEYRAALIARFWRKTNCQLCSDTPYVTGAFTFRCPWHQPAWPVRIPDEADGPPHPTAGFVPGWQAALDEGWEAYYRTEGRPEHWQDTAFNQVAAD